MKQIARRILNVAILARRDSAESQTSQVMQMEPSTMTPLSQDQLKNIVGGDVNPSPKGTW